MLWSLPKLAGTEWARMARKRSRGTYNSFRRGVALCGQKVTWMSLSSGKDWKKSSERRWRERICLGLFGANEHSIARATTVEQHDVELHVRGASVGSATRFLVPVRDRIPFFSTGSQRGGGGGGRAVRVHWSRRVYIRKDVEIRRYRRIDGCPGFLAIGSGTRPVS